MRIVHKLQASRQNYPAGPSPAPAGRKKRSLRLADFLIFIAYTVLTKTIIQNRDAV